MPHSEFPNLIEIKKKGDIQTFYNPRADDSLAVHVFADVIPQTDESFDSNQITKHHQLRLNRSKMFDLLEQEMVFE